MVDHSSFPNIPQPSISTSTSLSSLSSFNSLSTLSSSTSLSSWLSDDCNTSFPHELPSSSGSTSPLSSNFDSPPPTPSSTGSYLPSLDADESIRWPLEKDTPKCGDVNVFHEPPSFPDLEMRDLQSMLRGNFETEMAFEPGSPSGKDVVQKWRGQSDMVDGLHRLQPTNNLSTTLLPYPDSTNTLPHGPTSRGRTSLRESIPRHSTLASPESLSITPMIRLNHEDLDRGTPRVAHSSTFPFATSTATSHSPTQTLLGLHPHQRPITLDKSSSFIFPKHQHSKRRVHSTSPSITHSVPYRSHTQFTSRPSHFRIQALDSPAGWLALYFIFNLGLTLYNKGVLVAFPFPYTLTAVHAFCGSIGCWVLYARGYFTPAHLTMRENLMLSLFSVLYTMNIAVSNLSLQMVTVPFHQVVRASSPIFTIFIAYSVWGGRGQGLFGVGARKLLTLLPIVVGVGFATYGDYYFTSLGLILTLLGTFLAALKGIVTNILQTTPTVSAAPTLPSSRPHLSSTTHTTSRLKLHPLDLLFRMSPLAFIQCVMYAYFSGELSHVRTHTGAGPHSWRLWALLINGCIAFGLNVVSFTANKKCGPLTMSVAANVKQVLTILAAVFIFNITVSPTNMLGVALTLVGGGWYAAIELKEKRKNIPSPSGPEDKSIHGKRVFS